MAPLSIEQVLAEEVITLSDTKSELRADDLRQRASKQDAQIRRIQRDADARSGEDEDSADVEHRKAFYRSLNKLNRAALCLSGGGIRSATFCLGVIQALAAYDVTLSPPEDENSDKQPQNSLLGRFQFLSTVSGGGYIGSWLSAWRQRDDFPTVWRNLINRPDGPDVEPPELSWLRSYSNYLTPRTGVTSADAWTGVAIYLRNLILNWFVIIPVLCLALLALKLVATISVGIARGQDDWGLLIIIGLLGVVCLIKAQAFTTAHRPTRREAPDTDPSPRNIDQAAFLKNDLAWSLASAIALAIFLNSRFGTVWVNNSGRDQVLTFLAIAGGIVFAAGWLFGWPVRRSRRDFAFWILSGLVYGALVGLGAYLFTLLGPYPDGRPRGTLTLLLPMIFSVPWVLTSQLIAEMVFVGLVSYERNSDSDREWLGRAAGWVAVTAVVWAVTAFLSFAIGYVIIQEVVRSLGSYIASAGGVAGVVTAVIGGSAKTSAKSDADDQGTMGFVLNIFLAVAGPVFVAALVVGLSIALDLLLLGDSLVNALNTQTIECVVMWIVVGGIIAAVIGVIASKTVNINRFSLHAVYRNRLMRCYLGATRQARTPDRFTGFDEQDNLCAHTLWPPKCTGTGANTLALFHLINIALNVVDSKRLAWQERKAESFSVSGLHSGSAYKGFRASSEYGGPAGGISLGTAMAISGAAVSPNMGYHSSPSITLLLALFNVRLGWWLGNPGKEGEKSYRTEGPSFAIKPLIQEAFGMTTDDSSYVYLSDGGHFENLGLYEMVRRRCRFIVVVDAGCDPKFAFEDLGNAVRKIYIDLGIRIRFDDLHLIKNRPDPQSTGQPVDIPYHTIGVIDYAAADDTEEGCGNGTILYIKPAYHGTEGAGIRSYATAHPTFPHETTTDQWFTESQFESYRSLGLEITNSVLRSAILEQQDEPTKVPLREILAALPATTREPAATTMAR
jgi:Patatin-like phospholipase